MQVQVTRKFLETIINYSHLSSKHDIESNEHRNLLFPNNTLISNLIQHSISFDKKNFFDTYEDILVSGISTHGQLFELLNGRHVVNCLTLLRISKTRFEQEWG